jgi:hypothetical protein
MRPPQPVTKQLIAICVLLSMLFLAGCEARTDEADNGGILLSLEWTTFPLRVGVNDQDWVRVDSMDINSILVNPAGPQSDLMNVEVSTLEITYTRADTGTRIPVPYVVQLLGTVPAGGSLTYNGLPILTIDQMRSPPLSDLLFENGGVDQETGSETIRLNVDIRVFGRTIGGEAVASERRGQTVEFVTSLLTGIQ